MKYFAVSLFVIMIIAQWFVPLQMIFQQEDVLAKGKIFKFKTEPIDPSDPFRGKYITLRFAETRYPVDTSLHFLPGEDIYVAIANKGEYASIQSISREVPNNTGEYVKAKVWYSGSDSQVEIQYPFDKFYLEESKAADAERAYWEANRDSTQVAYALVAIKNGTAALKDVIINEKSVVDLVKEMNEDTE